MDCSFTLLVGVLGVSRVGAVPPIALLTCCPEADALLFADAMPAPVSGMTERAAEYETVFSSARNSLSFIFSVMYGSCRRSSVLQS